MAGKEEGLVFIEEKRTDSPQLDALPPTGSWERLLAEKKLVRKLDTRVLPAIILIYIMNFIDRNGVTTARLKGMEQDLHLTDVQYATVIAILFVSYSPAQIPSNMILNKITRPALYIGTCVVLWGLTSALTGVTKNFAGILICRIFIGLPEAAFLPGTIFLLSRWYTKKELALRSAILFAGLLISNAFGALMAAGILSNMEGVRGIRAWRWLFFIEGAITMVVGFASMWLLPDYPNNTWWITPFERRLAQARLSEDAGEADNDNPEDSPYKGLKMAILDRKVQIFALMNASQLLGSSFTQFFPTLTQTLGFDTTVSLLLAAPPWILASIVCCINAWHADRTGERFYHIVGWWWCAILGFIIAMSTFSIAGRYVSLFLMACEYSAVAMTLVWVSNTISRPPTKRAAAIGIVSGVGNLGSLMGSYTWKVTWGPQYHQSMAISVGVLVLSSVLAWVIRQILVRENKELDANDKLAMEEADGKRVDEAARLEGLTFEQAMQRRKGYRNLY